MNVFLLRLSLFICLCCTVSSVYAAKDLYLSATGDDSNNGLTPETAVKTLGKIHTLIGVGDIIHVKGMIDISQEVKGGANEEGTNLYQPGGLHYGGFFFKAGLWHNSKMIGTDPETDGFDAKGESRIFRIDGGTHSFENLLFTGGADVVDDGGSGLWMRSSTCTFTNCRFVGNRPVPDELDPTRFVNTNGQGGAAMITNATTTFRNCYFAENANTRGGALFIIGGTVNLEGCIFENHDLSTIAGSEGGAIYTWTINNPILNIDRCVFRNNTASSNGGAIDMNNRTNRENNFTVMKIVNSAFFKNEAFNNGGAFYYNNTRTGTADTILIANTSFFGNTAERSGGAIFLGATQPNSLFSLVNSSLISNYTRGNGGFGAGMALNGNTADMLKRIYNAIFDKNQSISQGIYSDLRFFAEPTQNDKGEKEVFITHTFIGTALDGNGVTGSFLTADAYPGNNINYSPALLQGETLVCDYVNAAGIDDDPEFYLMQEDFDVFAIPLKEDAPARLFGDAACLTQFDILKTDQLGKARVISGNACVAGATEVTIEETEAVAFDTYPLIDLPNGIKEVAFSRPENEFIVANEVVSLKNTALKNTELILYSITGNTVKTGKGTLSIAGLPKGVYIVKAFAGGKNPVQKISK
ncbi:MAG: hypothetical protein LBH61_06765 [Dysgonamonadaceae bacterium]|jgi:predicted outer membrane repeat protein|nr:hypothetical protein [Dysgonamonadaceae bacterium]